MNLSWLDWSIIAVFFIFITAVATYTRKYTRSVSDFLSASRCAGRYLLTVSGDMANLAAIAIVANFQMYYHAGFTVTWWQQMTMPIGIIIAITGFVIYRFRQTRAMTLAQFFEMRYSKRFRMFAGFMIFISGVLNFGIFPAVGTQFFMNFCGFHESFSVAGFSIRTYPFLMAMLLGVSLYFTYSGGQISVTLTDFIQSLFCNIVLLVITVLILVTVGWGGIEEVMSKPENVHMINPFQGDRIPDFNVWYFVMIAVLSIYGTRAWQGTQGFNCAALTPHEAKMGGIIGSIRGIVQGSISFILPVGAYVILRHSGFGPLASTSNAVLDSIANEQVRDQMTVPVVMSKFLPAGLVGCFVSVFIAAFIANHQAYLHSWGSIFIQDVMMPFRKEPFTQKQHMRLLRFSMLGVAVFIFIFSLLWQQTEAILLWFAVTGAIYMGGAGAVVIGGLYWKKGTTAAAYSSLITGSALAVSGIVIKQYNPHFFLNGMQISFMAAIVSCLVYVIVSLLNRQQNFDLDKLLHRGSYAVKDDAIADSVELPRGSSKRFWSILGLSNEFTAADKVIFFSAFGVSFFCFFLFVVVSVYHVFFKTSNNFWMMFWKYYILVSLVMTILYSMWVYIGGAIDVKRMLHRLRTLKRDAHDDGWVVSGDVKLIAPDGQLQDVAASENTKVK